MKKALFLIMVLAVLTGCSSMPGAGSEEQSLLVVLADEGGSAASATVSGQGYSHKISFSGDGIAFLPVPAGTVRLDGTESSEVPAGAVVLYPRVLQAPGQTRPVTVADQRRAMKILTDYVGFESWFGRDYVNFGPFRPKQYLSGEYFPLTLDSDPNHATILIDNVVWGQTPQTVELNAGKYLVEVRAAGYSPYKRIISLDGPLSLSPQLKALESGGEAHPDRFGIMVAPIRPMKKGDDPYGDVITSTLMVNFSSDSRLNVIPSGTVAASSDEYPDFTPAEEAGADLLVAGRYDTDGESLYLEAVLYETTSRRVKFAQTYVSDAGLAVFDSIDEIAARFASEVSRSLPDPGEPIVEKQAAENDDLLTYERSIYRQRMIESRLAKKNLISIKTGFGGLDDEYTASNGDPVYPNSGSIPSVFRLDYQRIVSKSLAFSASASMMLQGVRSDTSSDSIGFLPNIALFLGPEFDFRSEKSDVYFTPSFAFGWTPPFDLTVVTQEHFNSRFFTGLDLDVGYRYYFFQRRTDLPVFFNFGMLFDLFEVAFSTDQDLRIVPIRGMLYLGGGVGL